MSYKDFSYVETNEVLTIDEAKCKVLSLIGEDYDSLVEDIGKFQTSFVSFCMNFTRFEEHNGKVTFFFKEGITVKIDVEDVNFFCYIFKFGMTYRDYIAMTMCLDIGIGDDKYHYSNWKKKTETHECGQSKIAVSTLVPLINAESTVNILVIGSASEDQDNKTNIVSGSTYEMLVDNLTDMGYSGSLTLFDPHENNCNKVVGNFQYMAFAELYDYNKKYYPPNGEFTHIYDDAWVDNQKNEEIEYSSVNQIVIDSKLGYDGKFGYKIVDSVLSLKTGMRNHSEMSGCQAGGIMQDLGSFNGKKSIMIFGSSTRYKHYSRRQLKEVFVEYNLVFAKYIQSCLDKNDSLVKNYPTAVISYKYFGEKRKFFGTVFDQPFYNGKEKRYVYNMPHIRKGNWYGCGCSNCVWYSIIYNNFKCYNYTYKGIDKMLSTVINDPCVNVAGSKLLKVVNYIETGLRARRNRQDIYAHIKRKVPITDRRISAICLLLHRYGKIKFRTISDVAEYKYSTGKKKFKNSTDYITYDGDLCIAYSGDVIMNEMDYRPTGAIYNIATFIDNIYARYCHEFAFIEDYYTYLCDGLSPCGFNRAFDYYISFSIENDYELIYRFENIRLYKTNNN